MKVFVAARLVVLSSMGLFAQSKGPASADSAIPKLILKPATVSGSVFAITKGGDVKPARMAEVYLFYSRPAGKSVSLPAPPSPSMAEQHPAATFAADVFESEVVKGEEKARIWQQDKPYLEESTQCNSMLVRAYKSAIVETIRWGQEHQTQIVFGDADEDGKFEITIPPPDIQGASFEAGVPHDKVFAPGVYLVAVYGSAGYNNAFWETQVTVGPGDAVKIKMPAPTKVCPKMESQ